MRVLVLENSPQKSRLFYNALNQKREEPFDFSYADSLKKSLILLNNQSFDVILLDLYLRDSKGIGTYLALKTKIYKTPVIILTDLNNQEEALHCLEEGAWDYLVKGAFDGFLLIKTMHFASLRKQKTFVEKQLDLQLHIATTLAESTTVHHASLAILKQICDQFSFSMGEILAVDHESQVLRSVLRWSNPGLPSELLSMSNKVIFKRSRDIPAQIWSNKKVFFTNDLKKISLHHHKAIIDLGFHSCFGFPIFNKEEILGISVFYGNLVDEFDPEFFTIFEVVGKQIGSFFKSKRLEKDLLFLIKHDLLTGLPNREALRDFLENALVHAKRENNMIALLYLNLDRLRNINCTLGYAVGDIVLQEVAHRLQNITRKTDFVARFGGDEFAIVLTGIRLREHIDLIAKKILKQMEYPFFINHSECYMTASIGISLYPQDGEDAKSLFISASLAMYHSRYSGINNYHYVYSDWQKVHQKNILMEAKLHQALQRNEFFLCYQPIVNLKTNQIISVEALIRWNFGAAETVYPMNFIPLLEKSSLIQSIGEWTFETACNHLKLLAPFDINSMSINISVNQLNPGLIKNMQNTLTLLNLSPSNIILEITESALIDQNKNVIDIIYAFNQMGIKLSIDDFGTGYSSFSYLKNFSINFLKLDKSFISEINKTPNANAIVKAIILMAHELGMEVIAEGVEQKEQLEFLKQNGCDAYQGFYFSKPITIDELLQQLKTKKLYLPEPKLSPRHSEQNEESPLNQGDSSLHYMKSSNTDS